MEHRIEALCEQKSYPAVKSLLLELNVVDIADEIAEMDETLTIKVFRMLPKDKAVEVFAYLPPEAQINIVKAITDSELGGILDELFLDDAVDFIEEMPANVVKRVLANVPASKREIINQFLQYPEDSAGSVMTIEYVELKRNITVRQAFDIIRSTGVDKETIYTGYVIDLDRKLLGEVSVRTLLLANFDDLIGDIMEKNVVSLMTNDSRETLTSQFRRYGLLAMPVVDHENRLVGIVTVDDAFEVFEEETTEDFELMAAMSPSDEPYLQTGVVKLAKNRVLWLMILMLSATVTGGIISSFEDALAVLPALVAFIPMLMDTGGNAGAQSSTMIIRGMALAEIGLRDAAEVLWKELRVAVLCGGALAVVNFGRVMIMNKDIMMAFTVSAALYLTVIIAKTVGCLLPLGAKKLRVDPAVMASPVITTIVDAFALIVYFWLAKAILLG